MIIVDNAAESARGGREADPRRHGRRRLHGPGPDEPDRQQRARHAHGRDLQPASPSGRSRSTATPGLERRRRRVDPGRSSTTAIRARHAGRDRGPDAALPRRSEIDVLVDVTGSVEFGAHVILEAFSHGKHVVLMNAEVDATIGPILQVVRRAGRRHPVGLRRRRAGPADEPLPLGAGARPHPAGDRQRQGPAGPVPQPDDPAGLGRAVGPEPGDGDVSFADGSKISFEQAIVANATGFKVQVARHVARGSSTTARRHGDRRALRPRRAPRARRDRRLHGRARR